MALFSIDKNTLWQGLLALHMSNYAREGAKTEASLTTGPELHRIQNPAAQFRVGEDIEVTGYIIQEDAWRHKVTT